MSKSALFKYVVNVTTRRDYGMYWSTGSLAKLEDLFYTASVSEDAHSTAPEAIVKTVKTILACIL